MGGTRVLSNPPLTTVIAYAVYRAGWNPPESHGWVERMMIEQAGVEPRDAPVLSNGLRLSVVLCAIWVLSGWAAYALGRLFLSPAGAAVFALVVTFNPCTVHFSPGKDPAQLLTINLMLWAWFAAWQRRSLPLAALGGAALTVGATAGLIHVWVALVAVRGDAVAGAASIGRCRTVLRNALGAARRAARSSARSRTSRSAGTSRARCGPSRAGGRSSRRRSTSAGPSGTRSACRSSCCSSPPPSGRRSASPSAARGSRFGTRLACCTAAVMLLIYGPLGMTYELPRLWVAFLPPLVLGLMIDRPLFRARSSSPRAVRALVLIVAVHLAFTALHWTLFDARESEYRLTTDRFYY